MKKKLTYYKPHFLSQFLNIFQELDHSVHYTTVAKPLHWIGLPQEVSLNMVGGISILFFVLVHNNQHSSTILSSHFSWYENALSQISEKSQRWLGEFTHGAV